MNRFFHFISLALALIAACSCISGAPKGQIGTDQLTHLPRGITIEESQKRLETKLVHEFSERRDADRYDCMMLSAVEPPGSFYFIFANSNLVRIVFPPPF